MGENQLSDLARQILQAHESLPRTGSYASLRLIDRNDVAAMDAAYAELVDAGKVIQVEGSLNVGGEIRHPYKLNPNRS